MNVTFFIIDLWQSCVCFIRSGVIQCTLFMVPSLDRMYQHRLHAVLWSHIGTLMHCLAAEPCSTAGLLFTFRCPSGTILLTPFSMVWDWQVSRAGPMLLYWPKLLYPYYSLLLSFPFSSFIIIIKKDWQCKAGRGRLTPYQSEHPSPTLPTYRGVAHATWHTFSPSIFSYLH